MTRANIISTSEAALKIEIDKLQSDILHLRNSIEATRATVNRELEEQLDSMNTQLQDLSASTSSWQSIVNSFKYVFLERKIRHHEREIPLRVFKSVTHLENALERNINRYNFITSRFEDAVIDHSAKELKALVRKKNLIDEINSSIYGAIGEQKVVNELEKLSDDHILINDFCMSFHPPIYSRNENDRIHSIQVDHVLVSPSAVFLIETKNWSEESLNNISLRSPISQLKRSSYAIFTLLNSRSSSISLQLHHWGEKKIPVKNIVVIINRKPIGEFNHAKVLTLAELTNYITYFPPSFSPKETTDIANELLNLSRK